MRKLILGIQAQVRGKSLTGLIKIYDALIRPASTYKNSREVTLVQAKEINPPTGKSPLTWRLLSTRTVENEAQACELIDWYRCRWEIEMFFDVLKVGCKVEKLQLASKERLEKALIMVMIIAWRVMYLMRLGLACPDLPAMLIFDSAGSPYFCESSFWASKPKFAAKA